MNKKSQVLIKGLPASTGVSSGNVRIITHLNLLSSVQVGEILVTEKTTPDFTLVFKKIAGIITDEGGITSHAAIVARELGIPAVVGTKNATKLLKNGQLISLDGTSGTIYEGKIYITQHRKKKEEKFFIQKSGDELSDMVNAITSSAIDSRELWPVSPGQLFPYIDFLQSYDIYLKLQSLIKDGWSFQDIANLFHRPTVVKFFMMNSGATGLKVGSSLGLAPVTLEDNVQLYTWLIEILKCLTTEDPFALEGKNYLWDRETITNFVKKSSWISLKNNENLKREVNLLAVNSFTLNWSLYSDYYGANGCERHGAYPLPAGEFGENPRLLVRDFFNLQPTEIWPIAHNIPFKHIQLAQVYDHKGIYLNWGNTLVNHESLNAYQTFFTLRVDEKEVTDERKIKEITDMLALIAKEQTEYVNALPTIEKVRKCAMLAYYGLKDFYLHFSDEWYPKEKVEQMIESIGPKPLSSVESKKRTIEESASLFDPRIPWSP